MSHAPRTRIVLGVWTALIMAFLLVPIGLIVLYAFNPSNVQSWPIKGFSTKWFSEALDNQAMKDSFWLSIKAACLSTAIAITLGSMVAFAVHRFRFFGRETISFLVILPIALPGIVTGLALNATFTNYLGGLGFLSLIVAHATFCVVVVYNNVIARLRRQGGSGEEASHDLFADSFQTFRLVTFAGLRSAIAAGALLAFALSFDEIIVTTFTAGAGIQTLPQWIFNNYARPNQLPVVNVVAVVVVLLSAIPVWLAQRLSTDGGGTTSR